MSARVSICCLAAAALIACSSSENSNSGGGGNSNTGAGNSGASNQGSGGSGAASQTGTGASGGSAGGPPVSEVLRFVALGDGGEGNDTQVRVADAVKQQCDARGGCDFALYLGDNIYDTGVDSADDMQFQTKFEQPYQNLDFTFHIALGNHDYGGGGAGFEFFKGQYQIDYSAQSSKWSLPALYYGFSEKNVDFFALDTNGILYDYQADDQRAWFQGAVASSTGAWRIAFGHHTYVSNGQHGNAGQYEGIPGAGPCSTFNVVGIPTGVCMKEFFDDDVCGKVDLYLAGHDHNRQWLEPTCGTEFAVSGSAAKTTDLQGRGTPTFFEDDAEAGFMLIEIEGNSLTGWFYDENGQEEFTRTVTK